jgi:hypothetical protein
VYDEVATLGTFIPSTQLESRMMISDKSRGMLLLGFGAVFTVVFLAGGGVLTATNGGYWTLVFLAAYLCGLAVLGPLVYKSATKAACGSHETHSRSSGAMRRFLPALLFPLSLALSLAVVRSDTFATELGMHVFMIAMGIGLSLFVPLGLGTMHQSSEQTHAPEPPIRPGAR